MTGIITIIITSIIKTQYNNNNNNGNLVSCCKVLSAYQFYHDFGSGGVVQDSIAAG